MCRIQKGKGVGRGLKNLLKFVPFPEEITGEWDSLVRIKRVWTVAWELRREANIAHADSITEKGKGKPNSHGVVWVAIPCMAMCDRALRKPLGFFHAVSSCVPGIINVVTLKAVQQFLKFSQQLIRTERQVSGQIAFGRSPYTNTVTSTNTDHRESLALRSVFSTGEERAEKLQEWAPAGCTGLNTLMLARGEEKLKY